MVQIGAVDVGDHPLAGFSEVLEPDAQFPGQLGVDLHARGVEGDAADIRVFLGPLDEGEQACQGLARIEEGVALVPDRPQEFQVQVPALGSEEIAEGAGLEAPHPERVRGEGVLPVPVEAGLGLEAGPAQAEVQAETQGAVVEVAAGQPEPGHEFQDGAGAPGGFVAGLFAGRGPVGEEGQTRVAQGPQGQVEYPLAAGGGQGRGQDQAEGKVGRGAPERAGRQLVFAPE